jgi:hypothetical protein
MSYKQSRLATVDFILTNKLRSAIGNILSESLVHNLSAERSKSKGASKKNQ